MRPTELADFKCLADALNETNERTPPSMSINILFSCLQIRSAVMAEAETLRGRRLAPSQLLRARGKKKQDG